MTTKTTGAVYLSEQIKLLEEKEAAQTAILKMYVAEMLESIKPSSLFKSAVKEVVGSKDLQQNILDTSVGIGAGLLARKLYQGASKSIFKKLAGFVLQNLTTGIVTKKMPGIREKISNLQAS